MFINKPLKQGKDPVLLQQPSPLRPFQPTKPVEIQLKLVTGDLEIPRHIKSVTLTLSSLEEAWQIFEDLTNLAWEKTTQKQA